MSPHPDIIHRITELRAWWMSFLCFHSPYWLSNDNFAFLSFWRHYEWQYFFLDFKEWITFTIGLFLPLTQVFTSWSANTLLAWYNPLKLQNYIQLLDQKFHFMILCFFIHSGSTQILFVLLRGSFSPLLLSIVVDISSRSCTPRKKCRHPTLFFLG